MLGTGAGEESEGDASSSGLVSGMIVGLGSGRGGVFWEAGVFSMGCEKSSIVFESSAWDS